MLIVLLIVLLMIASVYDIRMMCIPLWIAVAGMLLAGIALCKGLILDGRSPGEYMISFMISVFTMLTWIIFRSLKSEIFGIGDLILLILIGAMITGECLISVLSIALILSGVFSGILLSTGRASRKTRIPFVPFLATAVTVTEVYMKMRGII